MKRLLFLSMMLFVASPAWGASTADPHATSEAKALLDYLVRLPGQTTHKMISGQAIWRDMVVDDAARAAGLPRPPFTYDLPQAIHTESGHYPGLLEMMEPSGIEDSVSRQLTLDHWNAGGILISHILIGNKPERWFGLGNVNLNAITSDPRYLAYLDELVENYLFYQSKGVVFIARPFLEMNGRWNWFYTTDYEQYKNLWVHFFTYMTDHGVHNLLYMYCPASGFGTYMERYPGSQYVDVVGLDSYFTLGDQPYQNGGTIDGYDVMIATGKPIGIGEYGSFGTEPLPLTYQSYDARLLLQGLKQNMPQIAFVTHWAPPFDLLHMSNVSAYMNDPYVQNRPVPFGRDPGAPGTATHAHPSGLGEN